MLPEWEEEDAETGYDAILVAFGGLGGELGIPQFEFRNTTAQIPARRVFIRDTVQSWYHGGAGPTTSVRELAHLLATTVQPYQRSVFIGNSSGGYAALLFGALVAPDEVYAFSPQTYLGVGDRLVHFDYRWFIETIRVRARGTFDREFSSVRPALERSSARTRFQVYFASDHRLDRSHAQHIAGIPNVSLHPMAGVDHHSLVKAMRDSGELALLLNEAIGVEL